MEHKNAVLAVVLSLVVLLGWNYFFSPEPPKQQPDQEKSQTAQPGNDQAKATKAQTAEQAAQQNKPSDDKTAKAGAEDKKSVAQADATKADRPARIIRIDNGLVELAFTEDGAKLVHARLKKYRETNQPGAPRLDLIKVKNKDWAPLGLGGAQGPLKPFENAFFKLVGQDGIDKIKVEDGDKKIVFESVSVDGLKVTKTFTIKPNSYLFGLDVAVENTGSKPVEDNLVLDLNAVDDHKEGGNYAFRGFGAYSKEELTETKADDLKEEPKVVSGEVFWGAYENSYFMQAILPAAGKGAFTGSLAGEQDKNNVIRVKYTSPQTQFNPGKSEQINFVLFFGPKRIDVLEKAGMELDRAINMGWFDILAKPFLYFLRWVYGVIGNYGVAIILLTMGVKLVFWPLTQKSYKSMKKMQDLQPHMAKLREKYKDDKQRMNQELMGLYKSRGVNPMGGCLPMVIQIPVFIALYRLLDYAIELRHAPFIFWITDLSAPDRLFHFPFSIPFMDPPYGVPVMTLLMGASMFIQQKMTPTPGDPTQAKMMMLMPVVFTFIFINFPSGLVLYWFVNNVLSIGQQYWINKGGKKVKA